MGISVSFWKVKNCQKIPEDSLLRASVCDQFQTENEGSECGMDRRALVIR